MKTLDILKSVWNTTAIRTSLFIIACVVCIFTVMGLSQNIGTEPLDVCIFVIIIPLLFCSISRGISIKYYFLYAIPLLPLAYSTYFMPQGYTFIFSSFILLIITLIYIAKKTVQWEYKQKVLWIISNLIISAVVWLFTLGFNPFIMGSNNIHNPSRLMQAWSYTVVEKDGKWGTVDAITGETIIPIKFDSIIYDKRFSLYSIQPHLVNNDITTQYDLLYNNHDTIFISLNSGIEERIKNGLRAKWVVRKTENKEMAIREMQYIRMANYAYGDLRKLFINRFDNDTTTHAELKHFNELENIVIDNLNYVLDSLIVKKANNANLDFNDISELRLSLSRAINYSSIKYTLNNEGVDINMLKQHCVTIYPIHNLPPSYHILNISLNIDTIKHNTNFKFKYNASDYISNNPIELNKYFLTTIFYDRNTFSKTCQTTITSNLRLALHKISSYASSYNNILSELLLQNQLAITNDRNITSITNQFEYFNIDSLKSIITEHAVYNPPTNKLDTLIFDKTPQILLNILDSDNFELNDYDTAIQDICAHLLFNATLRFYYKEDEIGRLLEHMKSSDEMLEDIGKIYQIYSYTNNYVDSITKPTFDKIEEVKQQLYESRRLKQETDSIMGEIKSKIGRLDSLLIKDPQNINLNN